MSGKAIKLRPKARHFKSRGKRAAFFRGLDKRTDRKARRNRELDRKRIEAGPLRKREQWERDKARLMDHLARITEPLPSQPNALQAER